jgi:hypothetical protein
MNHTKFYIDFESNKNRQLFLVAQKVKIVEVFGFEQEKHNNIWLTVDRNLLFARPRTHSHENLANLVASTIQDERHFTF